MAGSCEAQLVGVFSKRFHTKRAPDMDPLSSLGVAGNVIQFIDFGIKLVSRFKQIYRSADGALQENNDLSDVRPCSPFSSDFTY